MSGRRARDVVGRCVGTAAIAVALVLAAACGSTSVTASTRGTTSAPPGSGAGPATAPATPLSTLDGSPEGLTFRPVLQVQSTDPAAPDLTGLERSRFPDRPGSPPTDALPPTSAAVPTPDVVLLGSDAGTATGAPLRYALGPVVGDQRTIESATAAVDPQTGQWSVRLVLRPGDPGIDTFNRAAGPCYEMRATCPTGQLAIVVDGAVLAAPMVNAAKFDRDQIQLSPGRGDQASAEAFARRFTPH